MSKVWKKQHGGSHYQKYVIQPSEFVVKNRILVKKGKKVKLFAAKDIQKIDGVWTAKTLQMITTKNKKLVHKSIFQLKNVKYNTNVEDSIFETEVMQRGL